jgi:hypothetical protein
MKLSEEERRVVDVLLLEIVTRRDAAADTPYWTRYANASTVLVELRDEDEESGDDA